ncbi:hypothetical protein DL770_005626 [Monosporascus sp. CRB-9-2]|nr:hypothetical protein DL770_005626 [Monosporascus sp. CRB-9-2]
MPGIRALSESGFEVLALPLGARLAEAVIAVITVGLVTLVYTLLIQRGSLMATTCLYPRRPIEVNIGRLLDVTWPVSSARLDSFQDQKGSSSAIQLFYLGKMDGDSQDGSVAKGRQQSVAALSGIEKRRPVWLTSGSPLTKNVVQIMVWEWVSFWLMVFMFISTLMFNGFFTDNLNIDSFPRLTITLIYTAAYMTHFFYIWMVCLDFFKLVFAGASWSLLERSKFVVAETHKLQGHVAGAQFKFRGIDKANDAYVPVTFDAILGDPTSQPSVAPTANGQKTTPGENAVEVAELAAAVGTINASQKTEREYATEASTLALDRVIANSMVMMGVTLSCGFASWTSAQFTEDTPNNTTTNQIGSLALLGSLSLGAMAMFSSAMQLTIMKSSFRTIMSLKETKINGLALDLYRKTRATSNPRVSRLKPVAFTESNSVSLADIELADFFAANRARGWLGFIGMLLLGPGYAMLPRLNDHDRKSDEVEFDFVAPVEGGNVVLTTRETDRHAKGQGTGNLDPVIACYLGLSTLQRTLFCKAAPEYPPLFSSRVSMTVSGMSTAAKFLASTHRALATR